MADASLTQTAVYRKLKSLTKIIHEHRKPAPTAPAPAAVKTPVAPAAPVKARGGKRKAIPRTVRHFCVYPFSASRLIITSFLENYLF